MMVQPVRRVMPTRPFRLALSIFTLVYQGGFIRADRLRDFDDLAWEVLMRFVSADEARTHLPRERKSGAVNKRKDAHHE
jgi:hypothetical protein